MTKIPRKKPKVIDIWETKSKLRIAAVMQQLRKVWQENPNMEFTEIYHEANLDMEVTDKEIFEALKKYRKLMSQTKIKKTEN